MPLKLYSIPVSAYCAKVRLFAALRGLALDEIPLPGGSYRSAEYRAIVKAGSVPALDHDGFILFESEPIIEYLDEAFPGPRLLSPDVKERAIQRALARVHDNRVEPAVRALFPLVTSAAPREGLPKAMAAYDDALARLAGLINPAPFIAGETPGHADLGFPATLMMGRTIIEALGGSLQEPGQVQALMRAYAAHPAVKASTDICAAALDEWIKSKLK